MTTGRGPWWRTHTGLLNEKKQWGLKVPSPPVTAPHSFPLHIPVQHPVLLFYSPLYLPSALLVEVLFIIMSFRPDKAQLFNDLLSRCPWLFCRPISVLLTLFVLWKFLDKTSHKINLEELYDSSWLKSRMFVKKPETGSAHLLCIKNLRCSNSFMAS